MKRPLIITLACLWAILAGYVLAHSADFETTILATVSYADDLGYRAGVGLYAEERLYLPHIALVAHGRVDNSRKHGADEGYTYGYGVHARGYWRSFYGGAGYAWSGYRTEFADGTIWSKRGGSPVVMVGFDNRDSDIGVRYSFQESDTPNRVESIGLVWRKRMAGPWTMQFSATRAWFDQGGDRMSGWSGAFGIGVTF